MRTTIVALGDVRAIEVRETSAARTAMAFVLEPAALLMLFVVVACAGDSGDGGIGSPC